MEEIHTNIENLAMKDHLESEKNFHEMREALLRQLQKKIQLKELQFAEIHKENEIICAQLKTLELEMQQWLSKIDQTERKITWLKNEHLNIPQIGNKTKNKVSENSKNTGENFTQIPHINKSLTPKKLGKAELIQKEKEELTKLKKTLLDLKQKIADLKKIKAQHVMQMEQIQYEESQLSLQKFQMSSWKLRNRKTKRSNEDDLLYNALQDDLQFNKAILQDRDILQNKIVSLQSLIADRDEKLKETEKLKENYQIVVRENDTLREKLFKSINDLSSKEKTIDQYKKKVENIDSKYKYQLEKMKKKFKVIFHEEVDNEKEIITKEFTEKIQMLEELNRKCQLQVQSIQRLYLLEKNTRVMLQQQFEINDMMSHKSILRLGRENAFSHSNSYEQSSNTILDWHPTVKKRPVSFFVPFSQDTPSKQPNNAGPEHLMEPNTNQNAHEQYGIVKNEAGLQMKVEEQEVINEKCLNDFEISQNFNDSLES